MPTSPRRRRRSTRMPSARGCSGSGPPTPPRRTSSSIPAPTKNPREATMPDLPQRDRETLAELEDHGAFSRRHIGPTPQDEAAMLALLGYPSREALVDAAVPRAIRLHRGLALESPR